MEKLFTALIAVLLILWGTEIAIATPRASAPTAGFQPIDLANK